MLSPTPTSAQPSFTPFSINKYFVTLVQTSVVDCQVQKKSEREYKMQSVKIVKGKSPWCVVREGYEGDAATDRLASLLCVPIVNTAIITNNRTVLEGVNIRSC